MLRFLVQAAGLVVVVAALIALLGTQTGGFLSGAVALLIVLAVLRPRRRRGKPAK